MKTLQGVRIAITRAAAQNAQLAERLALAGADVLTCPLIKVEPRPLDPQMRDVLHRLSSFDWIVFTSVNGVEIFMQHASQSALQAARIACVGSVTAAALERYGRVPDVIPRTFVGDAVADAMAAADDLRGRRVLIARAAGGGRALPTSLRAAGAQVHDLELYRSVLDQNGAERLRAAVEAREIDVVTFTSGSTVTYFIESVGVIDHLVVAVIGPSTSEVAQNLGLRVDIEANPHTVDGLVTAIQEYYAARRGKSEATDAGK